MSLISILTVFLLPVLIIFYEIFRRIRYASLPPGPRPISFLGNITVFLNDPRPKHEILAELASKYGDIMTVWFFTKPVILLSSLDAVRKAYIEKQHEFASRPDSVLSVMLCDGYDLDVAFGRYSQRWAAKRKLLHGSVRQLVGTKHLENETIASIEQLVAKLLTDDGPVNMRNYLIQHLYNMSTILVFGKRFDLDDPDFKQFCQFHHVENEAISATRVYDTVPFMQGIAETVSPTLRNMKRIMLVYRNYLRTWFSEAEYPDGEIEYMTQAFLKGMHSLGSKEGNGTDNQQIFSDKEILAMLMDLFIGSTSTTSSALSWLFLEMVMRPEIQKRCCDELEEVVGTGRTVLLSDRPNLPYIEACILETLRFHSPVSLNLPHTPSNEAVLDKYKVPAGTETIFNIWSVHHDPTLWKDAHNFNPENFLDDSGQVVRPPQLIPFGAGRRVCLGESFAKNSIFLTFTVMLQQLRFHRVPGFKYSLERSVISGEFINVPNEYMVTVSRRE